MTPFGDLESRPPRRPASPFVLLLLGGAATALGAEWLRFQGAPALAIVPAALGSVITITSVARAYRARRRWRRDVARRSADLLAARGAGAEPAGLLTIREEDGRLAIIRAVAQDAPPSPLVAHPAGERATDLPRSVLGASRDNGSERGRDHELAAARDRTSLDAADAADAAERQPSHADR